MLLLLAFSRGSHSSRYSPTFILGSSINRNVSAAQSSHLLPLTVPRHQRSAAPSSTSLSALPSILPAPLASLVSSLATAASNAPPPPPLLLFSGLMSAGIGLPISEDALVAYAGVFLPRYASSGLLPSVLIALYLGVVLSDFSMYFSGRLLRKATAAPIRHVVLGNGAACEENDEGRRAIDVDEKAPAHLAWVSDRMASYGRYVGFATRLSVGIRGPLMLLTGFTSGSKSGGGVRFRTFAVGCSVGACLSMPLQLGAGWMLRGNPGVVGAAATAIGAGMAIFSVTMATCGMVTAAWK